MSCLSRMHITPSQSCPFTDAIWTALRSGTLQFCFHFSDYMLCDTVSHHPCLSILVHKNLALEIFFVEGKFLQNLSCCITNLLLWKARMIREVCGSKWNHWRTAHATWFTVPHLTAGIISNIPYAVLVRATKASPSGNLQTISFVTHKNRRDIANIILAKSFWWGLSKGSPRSYLLFPVWSCLVMTVTDLRVARKTELQCIKINYSFC